MNKKQTKKEKESNAIFLENFMKHVEREYPFKNIKNK